MHLLIPLRSRRPGVEECGKFSVRFRTFSSPLCRTERRYAKNICSCLRKIPESFIPVDFNFPGPLLSRLNRDKLTTIPDLFLW